MYVGCQQFFQQFQCQGVYTHNTLYSVLVQYNINYIVRLLLSGVTAVLPIAGATWELVNKSINTSNLRGATALVSWLLNNTICVCVINAMSFFLCVLFAFCIIW